MMGPMRRPWAVLLLALAGCHSDDAITVINTGAEPVLVKLEWRGGRSWDWTWSEDDDRHFEVPAGGIVTEKVGRPEEVDVLILRKSDGLVLLADDFEQDDFESDHGHIEITVAP